MINIIVAIAENRAIGLNNKLIYWLPNDLKRFKQLTTGNTIIMGRNTFLSLPKGALPNRRNIVLSRTQTEFPGADHFSDLQSAISDCRQKESEGDAQSKEIYIIGGASVYQQALELAEKLCLTYIHDTPADADTFFPEINPDEWEETMREDHEKDEKHEYCYSFIDLKRK